MLMSSPEEDDYGLPLAVVTAGVLIAAGILLSSAPRCVGLAGTTPPAPVRHVLHTRAQTDRNGQRDSVELPGGPGS